LPIKKQPNFADNPQSKLLTPSPLLIVLKTGLPSNQRQNQACCRHLSEEKSVISLFSSCQSQAKPRPALQPNQPKTILRPSFWPVCVIWQCLESLLLLFHFLFEHGIFGRLCKRKCQQARGFQRFA